MTTNHAKKLPVARVEPLTILTVEQHRVAINDICECLCTLYHNGQARVLLVDGVKVRKEFRGRGYGTRLMGAVVDLARGLGVDCIELCVDKGNPAARRLYEKAGFKDSGKVQARLILRRFR